MARIRTIKPTFWTSEQVIELSRDARLLFIGMWNFCDDRGVHPVAYKTLKAEVFPADDIFSFDVEKMVSELVSCGLLSVFEAEGRQWWYVTGWNHQLINRPSKSRYPEPPRTAPLPSAAGEGVDSGGQQVADAPAFHDASLSNHGAITDDSLTEGKGREEERSLPIPNGIGGEISLEISPVLPADNSILQSAIHEKPVNGKVRIPCPYQKILALYDKHLPMCPRLLEWTESRRKHLSALWNRKASEEHWETAEQGLEYFDAYFEFVGRSQFLTGRVDGRNGKPPFVANLEWLITPSRFANVVEGKYHA